LDKGCKVIIAADQTSIDLLRFRFPELEFILFPSLNVKLSNGNHQVFALFQIAVDVILLTKREHQKVKEITRAHNIDIIISDNRYGLYAKGIKSVLITHQLKIIFPKPFAWAMPLGKWFIRRYAERFSECWIPDNEKGLRLSGELSNPKKLPKNSKFIGLLSRFQGLDVERSQPVWDIVGIISGPPPHRENLEVILIELANRLKLKTLIVQGLPEGKHKGRAIGKTILVPHLADGELVKAMCSTKLLICRSGYSSIMDLVTLNIKALLIPTPGQTEQEYLASYLSANSLFYSIYQNKLANISAEELRDISVNLTKI
jgi:hypothetical protein